ncbi:MAG: YigZ family protein [Bacteroidota bacterium]
MLTSDQYKTLQESSTGEFRDRGSKFVSYAFPAYTQEDWQQQLEEVKKEHFKARHHCYAYRLGIDKTNFRANDDGEPSGTAGRPILGQIDSFGLSNVFIVVVRYFGGTKLGTSGLINAYRTAAADALEKAEVIIKTIEDIYEIQFDYSLMSQVMNGIKKLELEMVQQDFGDVAKVQVAIPQRLVSDHLKVLRAAAAQVRIEEIDAIETIDGFRLAYLFTR